MQDHTKSFADSALAAAAAARESASRAVRQLLAGIGAAPLAGIAVLLALLSLPFLTILALAVSGAGTGAFPGRVLSRTLVETGLLLGGVATLTLATGTGAAWLVTMYQFPGRALVDRLLVLPLAIPTYIVAYAYVELLDYSGPVQRALRDLMGYTSARDYWFPDIRSLGGGIFVMSAVLYPYVYLTARASFVQQSVCVLEVARTLGRTSLGAFRSVALPLARPALTAGVALVLMETLNDLGAAQYLGINSLSASIYATWLQRGSLQGAAQIAIVALLIVVVLLSLERYARRGGIQDTTGRMRAIPFQELGAWRGLLALAACLLPVIIGLLIPVGMLLARALVHHDALLTGAFWRAMANSVLLSILAAALCVAVALSVAYARRIARSPFMTTTGTAAGLGYAMPGTILALGLIFPLAAFDNRVDAVMRDVFGVSSGLLISGGIGIVIFAYVIRFLSVSMASVEAGMDRLSPNLDAAARALGETAWSALWRVHVPLLVPALGASALLVFVDCMKELPATLLLRPFDFDTLATHVYALAALEQFEAAAVGALAIVAAGLVPLLLLHRAIAGGRV